MSRGLWAAAGFFPINVEYVVKGNSKKTAWQIYGTKITGEKTIRVNYTYRTLMLNIKCH